MLGDTLKQANFATEDDIADFIKIQILIKKIRKVHSNYI